MKSKNAIVQALGQERAALYEAEIQHLVERSYPERDLVAFLETYALPTGIFYALSMFTRSKLSIKDMKQSLDFLFNPTPTITKTLREHLSANSRILDFGCGRGQITCALVLRGFQAYGVDISQDALEIARKLAYKLNCKATFYLAENNKLPFPDEHFDAALSFWTFHEVQQDQMPQTVAELHRTVRRDGYAFIVDQQGVAEFETIKSMMNQHGFTFQTEKTLSPVYDHGKASKAIMLTFTRKR